MPAAAGGRFRESDSLPATAVLLEYGAFLSYGTWSRRNSFENKHNLSVISVRDTVLGMYGALSC